MKISKIIFPVLIGLIVLLITAGCSNVKNREKSIQKSEFKGSSVSIKVLSKSTTNGTETTTTLDKEIEKKVSKTLSQVLISGEGKKELFSEQSFAAIGDSFPNHKQAKNNSANVSYHFLDSDIETNRVVVASVVQKVKTNGGTNFSNTGKIYLNNAGTIIGYDMEPSQTTERGST